MRRYLWDWIPGYDPEKVNKMARIDRPLRVGVIGTGGIANSHIQGYLKAENVELHATCDVIESRAKGVAEKYGFKHHFTSWGRDDQDRRPRRGEHLHPAVRPYRTNDWCPRGWFACHVRKADGTRLGAGPTDG